MTLTTTNLEGLPLVHRGKVRETYEVDDRHLLLVATDRLSAFDVVFEQAIPDKGAVLTRLSHLVVRAARRSRPVPLRQRRSVATCRSPPATPELAPRSMLVRRAERVDAECVVRGYLAGSGWVGVPAQRDRSCGHELPERTARGRSPARADLHAVDQGGGRPRREHQPRASWPTWSARTSREQLERALDRALPSRAARRAEAVGLILADTKFEFGFIDGELAVIDEVLTPDSVRFWDGERYAPGSSPPSFDKQFVRDFVAASGWNQEPPAPTLPDEVIEGTRDRYVAAYERLTGRTWELTGVRWLAEVHVALRGRDRRSGGPDDRVGPALARVSTRWARSAAGSSCGSRSRPMTTPPPRPRSTRCAGACSPIR